MKSPYEVGQPDEEENNRQLAEAQQKNSSVRTWIITSLVLAGFSLLYRLIAFQHLEQTALMFIALPTALAIACSYLPTPRSITGKIMKGMTMSLLLLGILAIEGFICIVIALPLFLFVGLIIGLICDRMAYNERQRNAKKGPTNLYCVAIISLAICSVEGINDSLSFSRDEEVTVEKTIDLPASEIFTRLAKGPQFNLTELPGFLKLGFPTPQTIDGTGIQVGDQWEIYFEGGEGEPGTLTVQVTERSATTLKLTAVSDTSHIAHWLTWKEAIWEVTPETANRANVKLTLLYDRELDPYWYFKPVERYGVAKAAGYFLDQTFKE